MEEHEIEKEFQELLKNIAYNVKFYRLKMGISQEQLSFKADIDRTYVGYIENKKHNISLKKLLQISNALNVEIIDLLKIPNNEDY